MTGTHNRALRSAAVAAIAFAGTLASFGLTTQQASAQPARAASYYTAALTAPLAAPQQHIVNGVLWKCAGDTCTAPGDASRDVMVCARLARKVGPVATFTSPRGRLAEGDLARCNAG